MKWLLILYFANGAQATYLHPFRTQAECEIAQSIATARYSICEALHPDRAPRLVASNCAPESVSHRATVRLIHPSKE